MKYTSTQAAQVERDTTFVARIVEGEYGYEERDYAEVAAPNVGESDPAFYIDSEWVAWMGDRHPELSIEDMADAVAPGYSWVVWVIRRADA